MNLLWKIPRRVVAAVVAVVLACTAFVGFRHQGAIEVTAYFAQFKGIYVGDDVTVLGVPVGSVTSVEPESKRVKVTMSIDQDQKVPSDARAAVVASSLVSVRSIILGPASTSGPSLKDGDVIPESRTSIPVEWDAMKAQLVELSRALGPKGANDKGATSRLITSTANLLDGQGQTLNQTVRDVSQAMGTLADNSGELFATVRNLQVFVEAIKGSDTQVRLFTERLADVAEVLDAERNSLAGALRGLNTSFRNVQGFLKSNKRLTVDTLKELRSTTSLLAADRQQIADLLQAAPSGASNVYNVLDTRGPAITAELAFTNLKNPASIMCGALLTVGGDRTDCERVLAPLVQYFAMDPPPLGIGGVTSNDTGAAGLAQPGNTTSNNGQPSPDGGSSPAGVGDLVDLLLGGL